MSSSAASSAISALSPGGVLMQSGGQHPVSRKLSFTLYRQNEPALMILNETARKLHSCML